MSVHKVSSTSYWTLHKFLLKLAEEEIPKEIPPRGAITRKVHVEFVNETPAPVEQQLGLAVTDAKVKSPYDVGVEFGVGVDTAVAVLLTYPEATLYGIAYYRTTQGTSWEYLIYVPIGISRLIRKVEERRNIAIAPLLAGLLDGDGVVADYNLRIAVGSPETTTRTSCLWKRSFIEGLLTRAGLRYKAYERYLLIQEKDLYLYTEIYHRMFHRSRRVRLRDLIAYMKQRPAAEKLLELTQEHRLTTVLLKTHVNYRRKSKSPVLYVEVVANSREQVDELVKVLSTELPLQSMNYSRQRRILKLVLKPVRKLLELCHELRIDLRGTGIEEVLRYYRVLPQEGTEATEPVRQGIYT